jgi:sulfate transport system substrate-binding protein
MFNFSHGLGALALGLSLTAGLFGAAQAQTTLLNVSYDPTREFYEEYNALFAQHWQEETGETIAIEQSHGGSGRQARGVIEGLDADVVTLALGSDIDAIAAHSGKISPDWRGKFPHNSAPYTSTIVFLVRKGNPKEIHDWSDLVKDGVEIVTPNPKTSGGARWNYLAAWAFANNTFGGDQEKIKTYMTDLFSHVVVMDTGARGATTTFTEREMGDVLLAWENEAYLALKEMGPENFDIVVPPLSILAEPPVAVVDANVDKRGTRQAAEAYLQYLYSDEAQTLIARHFFRPVNPGAVPPELLQHLPDITLVTIDDPIFGGWEKTQAEHFSNGGIFDQIQAGRN